jgi:hypothetical protein
VSRPASEHARSVSVDGAVQPTRENPEIEARRSARNEQCAMAPPTTGLQKLVAPLAL